MKSFERIVIDPNICHGKPTIKGTRIMVSNIVGLLTGGASVIQVIDYYPDLEVEDVVAALEYSVESQN